MGKYTNFPLVYSTFPLFYSYRKLKTLNVCKGGAEGFRTGKECMEYIRKKVGMKKERKVCPIIFNWLHLPPE
jgi:hypothetical protein